MDTNTSKEYLALIADKRRSVRTDKLTIISKLSVDNNTWTSIGVSDISAGGLLFRSNKQLENGASVWFDLRIEPLIPIKHSQMHVKAQGKVLLSRDSYIGTSVYAAKFTEIEPSCEAELDMLIHQIYEKYGAGYPD